MIRADLLTEAAQNSDKDPFISAPGTFAREFTQSPAGPLPPNGKRVVFDLSNIFRFDDQGRMVEEWVRTDYRSFLRQLRAPGK